MHRKFPDGNLVPTESVAMMNALLHLGMDNLLYITKGQVQYIKNEAACSIIEFRKCEYYVFIHKAYAAKIFNQIVCKKWYGAII